MVIHHHDSADANAAQAIEAGDLSRYLLSVIAPDESELAAHAAVLAELDKSTSGKTIWRMQPAQISMA